MEAFTFNTAELILLSVAGVLFIIQVIYYLGYTTGYIRITKLYARKKFISRGNYRPFPSFFAHATKPTICVRPFLPFWNRTIPSSKSL